jgi:DNA repair exonuclease SbcCD ATPase subunit
MRTVTNCPTCGAECKVEGNTTHYYVPVCKDRIAELESQSESRYKLNETCLDRIAELELQLWEAQDSYKVMCDRVDELDQEIMNYCASYRKKLAKLEQDIADMDKENDRLWQENERLRSTPCSNEAGFRQGMERAAEIAHQEWLDGTPPAEISKAIRKAIRAELEPVTTPNPIPENEKDD